MVIQREVASPAAGHPCVSEIPPVLTPLVGRAASESPKIPFFATQNPIYCSHFLSPSHWRHVPLSIQCKLSSTTHSLPHRYVRRTSRHLYSRQWLQHRLLGRGQRQRCSACDSRSSFENGFSFFTEQLDPCPEHTNLSIRHTHPAFSCGRAIPTAISTSDAPRRSISR